MKPENNSEKVHYSLLCSYKSFS